MLAKLREERQQRLDRHDLGGSVHEIARELDDIVDEERHAIENVCARRRDQRDERRAQTRSAMRQPRHHAARSDADDLAGKVRELSATLRVEEAQQRFEQMMDRLREQLMQQSSIRCRRACSR